MISVIIPLYNEEKSIMPLYYELRKVLSQNKLIYEIIFINDGSTDNSGKILTNLSKKNKLVHLITHRANFGKSLALAKGFANAKGKVFITMDADLQDNPSEIPKLLKKLDEGYDLVSGWRKKRADKFAKKISSALFNKGTNLISGVSLHDFNCGLKVIKKIVADEIDLYGELHRFIPVLAAKKKFKVTEVPVNHRPRKYGKSKYGLERSWRGVIDLLTTIFISDYAGKPAHFFGKIGLMIFLIGVVFDVYIVYLKITTGSTQEKLPLLLAGILFIVVGIQLLSTGLIAEMITHYYRKTDIN